MNIPRVGDRVLKGHYEFAEQSLLQLRKIFCYAYNEETASYDVANVTTTSPSDLSNTLKRKNEEKPEVLQKVLDSRNIAKKMRLDECYTEVSVRLFMQSGLKTEKDIAKVLQEEHFFHFGVRPAVYSYDSSPIYAQNYFIPGKAEGTERLFKRIQPEEDPAYFLERNGNPKLILPAKSVK